MNCFFEELGAYKQILYVKEWDMDYKIQSTQQTLDRLNCFSRII